MRNRFLFAIFSIFIFITQFTIGQEVAITERGDSVVLYADGTWDYYENFMSDSEALPDIKLNQKKFSKPNSSTKKINGSNHAYEIWYNDKKWKRIPVGEVNPSADIALKLIEGDAYAMIIYEELEIPAENLVQIALTNAINVAPDIKMTEQEYRILDNDTLIWMRMDGTTQGMKITYYSYYYSNGKGTIQFHTFTGQNLIDKYKDDLEDILNGLTTND